jgi:hypothetical protein
LHASFDVVVANAVVSSAVVAMGALIISVATVVAIGALVISVVTVVAIGALVRSVAFASSVVDTPLAWHLLQLTGQSVLCTPLLQDSISSATIMAHPAESAHAAVVAS